MKTLLYVIIPSLLAALLWLAINRDEQLRLGLFTKAAWEGISRRFSFLWEVHLRRLLGSKNRPALINIELNVVDEGTPYQGRIVLETASYFTLNFIFQPPPGRCPETHSVDISIADWEGVIHYQDRVDFCCGRDRRWMRFSSKQFLVSGQMPPGRWVARYSLDGGRSRGFKFQVAALTEVFTSDGGIVDNHSRLFGQKT